MKNPHAQALGKLGGKVKSEKKTAAVRENGKLGGRPPKCTCDNPKLKCPIHDTAFADDEI